MLEIRTQTPLKLPKEYLVGDQYFTPSVNDDLSVQIHDVSGAPVGNKIYPDLTEPDWVVPASHFSLGTSEDFKLLFLDIKFVSENQEISWSTPLRVVRFKPITVTTGQVRNLLGASNEELPDSVFDIYGAYLEICQQISADIFSSLDKISQANQALLLRLALNQLPTLPLRLLKTRQVDDHKMTRQTINYDKLQGELYAQYESILITHFNYVPLNDYEPLMVFVDVPDPMTGE